VTFVQLLHIYGYSYAIFIPGALLYLIIPLYRVRIFLLIVSGLISLYYVYKETKDVVLKYFDEDTLR